MIRIMDSSYGGLCKLVVPCRILQAKVVEKIKTHILCSIIFYKSNAIYKIMWKNMVDDSAEKNAICMSDK
jgi:hypothetical protein